MNNLILLVKSATAVYNAWRLKDDEVIAEVLSLVDEIPKTKNSLVAEDKKVEKKLRELITWISEQPKDMNIITSLLNTKIADILLLSPELERVLEDAFINIEDKEDSRQLIFQIIKEIKEVEAQFKFNFKLKSMLRPIMFEGEEDLSKADYIKLAELLESRISSYGEDYDKAIMEEVGRDESNKMVEILNQFKIELSPEGILKTGLKGLNEALYPDCGFRRSLFYLIEALTNRGKSFFLAHLLSSFVMYNKPMLRDKTKIPTIFFCSAEDSMGLILRRMFELFITAKTGDKPDFFEYSSEDVIKEIIKAFDENGWSFKFFRVNPTYDNIRELKQRVRNLEMKGHEIIVAAYDYLGMMDLDGCSGDTKSDKYQDLVRQARNFFISRGAIGISPWQLNPKAKELLRENDDLSEFYFAREIGGHSMTEGSTKITNETDVSITAHMAKLGNGEAYFTLFVGKMRGDGAPLKDRFCGYPVEQERLDGNKIARGLIHDINLPKSTFRRSLSVKSEADGGFAEMDMLV